MADTWRQGLAALAADNRSGSAEIEARAARLLAETVQAVGPSSAPEYCAWLLARGRELVAAQPAMAALFRLANDLLWACHKASDAEAARRAALSFLQEREARGAAAMDALAAHAANALARHGAIMTYSRSSTVLRALRALAESGKRPRVYCGEARPMQEGLTLARELADAGLDVVLGVDMALFGWLPEVDALLLGADALSVGGLLNKIGSAALARAAADAGLPCVVLCTSTKLLPEGRPLGRGLRSGAPDEVAELPAGRVEVRNPYFEVVPLECVSGVITEDGLLPRDALRERLDGLRVFPGLEV